VYKFPGIDFTIVDRDKFAGNYNHLHYHISIDSILSMYVYYLRVLVLVKADLADVVSGSCSSGKTPAFTPVGRWHCSTSFIVALPISLYSFFNFLHPNPPRIINI
jgi:hypothetical protein